MLEDHLVIVALVRADRMLRNTDDGLCSVFPQDLQVLHAALIAVQMKNESGLELDDLWLVFCCGVR